MSRACKIVSLPRSQFYYTSKKDDTVIISELEDLAYKHPSYGFRKLSAYLRRAGHPYNHKKAYRVYKLLKLNKRRKGKRRLPSRIKQPLQQQQQTNASWSMDFMSDSMVGNRNFRTFNVMDDCSREALAIEIDTSLSARRIIRVLEKVTTLRVEKKQFRILARGHHRPLPALELQYAYQVGLRPEGPEYLLVLVVQQTAIAHPAGARGSG